MNYVVLSLQHPCPGGGLIPFTTVEYLKTTYMYVAACTLAIE
jgi:hypothetical protein